MPLDVLICGTGPVSDTIHETPLGRSDLKRHRAENSAAALSLAPKVAPRLVLIDRAIDRGADLVQKLRKTPPTTDSSIVIVADDDFAPIELDMLEQGANAVLRLPPGPEWEERLARLLDVPVRKQIRVRADLEFAGELDNRRISGRTLNVSKTGMLIECDTEANVGEPIRFKLEIGYDDAIEGTARIVRIAGKGQYGCEFLEMDAWARKKVELYVQRA